jgi:nitrate reductase NapE component
MAWFTRQGSLVPPRCHRSVEQVGYRRPGRPQQVKGISIFRVLQRSWIPLVIVVVVGLGGFTVWRIHGIFGSDKRPSYSDSATDDSKPFNPKRLTYEVFGPPGTVADISYFDVDADPKRVDGAQLPWSLNFTTTSAAVMGNIVAQGNRNTIGCRIVVDGVVKAEKISHEVNAFTYCVLKAA